MSATHIALGKPAHDSERQGIRFLVENLPDDWVIYSNAFLVEHSGVAHELDTVIVAPHGITVVELKSWRGRVSGNDYDWFVPQAIRGPLAQNRRTAQSLRQGLKQRDAAAGRVWVDHFVFLSHTDDVDLRGGMSRLHVHTRGSIIAALRDAAAYARRAVGGAPPVDTNTRKRIDELLRDQDERLRPKQQLQQWVIDDTLTTTDRFVEYRAHHVTLPEQRRILRVYPLSETDQKRVRERAAWEAQVFAQIGRHPAILLAESLFETEEGLCIPFEDFQGVTLHTWLERYAARHTAAAGTELRLKLWKQIAEAIAFVHEQGVVHRLLRDDVVLLPANEHLTELRITGFDLAKQLNASGTIALSTLSDERLATAAPELLRHGFSSASPATDQWALGVLLGELFKGARLFNTTDELLKKGVPSLRALRPSVTVRLDAAFQKMLAEAPVDRFASVKEAIDDVCQASDRVQVRSITLPDPENYPEGTKLGTDYEIRRKLGSGGLSTVYEVHHLVTGTRRAIKIAREERGAADALQDEYEVLQRLSHPHIVRVIDPTRALVPGRLTLVMERVKGESLAQWLKARKQASPQERRLMADSLLSALEYLEAEGITHKDIKPDNLMVSEHGLTLIDFSLARRAPDERSIGTAAWRDPKMERWDFEADRYAAALCLFELFTERHPFDRRPPSPDEAPELRDDELGSPGLRRFFTQALSPRRESRFASAKAMRAFFAGTPPEEARPLELEREPPAPRTEPVSLDGPLAATGLSGTAVACLRRSGVTMQSQLVRLENAQLDAISGLGKKKRDEVVALRDQLRAQAAPAAPAEVSLKKSIWPSLIGDQTPVQSLGLKPRLVEILSAAGMVQVGQVANASRTDLRALEGFGAATLETVGRALDDFERRKVPASKAETLDELLAQGLAGLEELQFDVLDARFGLHAEPLSGSEIAAKLGKSQPDVSLAETSALDRLDRRALGDLLEAIEAALGQAGGVETIEGIREVLTHKWPVEGTVRVEGVITLVQRLNQTRFQLHHTERDGSRQLLRLPTIDREALDRLLEQARGLARDFPRHDGEVIRRTLRTALSGYELDPIALVTRLESDLRCTDTEQLYETPLSVERAFDFALGLERRPEVPLRELLERLRRTFGEGIPDLDEAALVPIAARSSLWVLHDGTLRLAGLSAPSTPRSELPHELRSSSERPEQRVASELRHTTRGFRLLVTPPERHLEIGRSVAASLGVPLASFEHAFLEHIEPTFEEVEKGERFLAMKGRLTQAAEESFWELVRTHSGPGKRLVMGDTGLWRLLSSTHLPRLLYDLTTERDLGLCVLVVPGLFRNGKVDFNGTGEGVLSVPGTVFPLDEPFSAT